VNAAPPTDLVAHPAARPRADLQVAAGVRLDSAGLRLSYLVRGDVAALALPEPASRPGRRDRLWQHTCFEAFVGAADGDGYLELNLGPSGDWALWAFDGYRAGMRAAATSAPPRLRVLRGARELRCDALVAADVLHGFLGAPPHPAGLTVVLEERCGVTSLFALRHPAERPDFHDRAGWTATVYPCPDA
jgi:hypothetical protein